MASQASEGPAPAPAPTPPTPHQTISVATFTKSGDALDECAEFTFWTDKPMDRKNFQAFLKSKGTTLNQGCDEAFPDRPVFASCATSLDTGDAGIPVDLVSRYCDAVTLDNNDTYMKNCFQSGGRWRAVYRAHLDPLAVARWKVPDGIDLPPPRVRRPRGRRASDLVRSALTPEPTQKLAVMRGAGDKESVG